MGDTVTWTSSDDTQHTVTGRDRGRQGRPRLGEHPAGRHLRGDLRLAGQLRVPLRVPPEHAGHDHGGGLRWTAARTLRLAGAALVLLGGVLHLKLQLDEYGTEDIGRAFALNAVPRVVAAYLVLRADRVGPIAGMR